MIFPRGPLVFHGLAIVAGVAGAFLTTRPPENRPDLSGSIAEDGSIESRQPDLLEIARTTQPADFEKVLNELLSSENPEHASDALEATRLLCWRWIQHDPQAVLALMIRENFRPLIANPILRVWMTEDPEGAFTAIQQIEDPEARKRCFSLAPAELCKSDPEKFFELEHLIPADVQLRGFANAAAVKYLAMRDPEKAVLHLERLDAEYFRKETITLIARTWTRTDPDAALAWAESLDSPASRQNALKTVLLEVAKTDLEAAHRLIEESGIGARTPSRGGIIGEIGEALAESDALQAAAWICRYSPKEILEDAATDLILDIDDPKLALSVLDTLPPGPARDLTASNRFLNWKTGDPEIAWEWIQGNLKGDWKKTALDALAQSIGESRFEPGWTFAETLGNSEETGRFRRDLIAGLGRFDFDRARQMAGETGDPDFEATVIAEAINERAHSPHDPGELANLIAELPADYPYSDPPHFFLAARWVREDSEAAAAWVQSLPAGSKARASGFEGLASTWAREDAASAQEWFATQPPGEERDAAFDRISPLLSEQGDHPGAFSSALEIANESLRTDRLQKALKAWRKRDPNAAWSAVESSDLNAADKERLFRQFQFE